MTCKSTVNVCNFDADRETVRIRIWDLVTFYYELRCYNKINETESSKNSTAAEKLMLFPENWHLCWCLRKNFPFSRVFLPQVLALFLSFRLLLMTKVLFTTSHEVLGKQKRQKTHLLLTFWDFFCQVSAWVNICLITKLSFKSMRSSKLLITDVKNLVPSQIISWDQSLNR